MNWLRSFVRPTAAEGEADPNGASFAGGAAAAGPESQAGELPPSLSLEVAKLRTQFFDYELLETDKEKVGRFSLA